MTVTSLQLQGRESTVWPTIPPQTEHEELGNHHKWDFFTSRKYLVFLPWEKYSPNLFSSRKPELTSFTTNEMSQRQHPITEFAFTFRLQFLCAMLSSRGCHGWVWWHLAQPLIVQNHRCVPQPWRSLFWTSKVLVLPLYWLNSRKHFKLALEPARLKT